MYQSTVLAGNSKPRIDWIDFSKGITLLLVVIGHSVSEFETGSITRGVIFSFHMPLFFILSCITFKWSTDIQTYIRSLKKAARHLLIPAAVVYIILIIADIIKRPALFTSSDFWRGKLFTFIFSCGVRQTFGNISVPAIGMIWFFLALFIARAIIDYLHLVLNESMLLIVTILCGIVGIVTGQLYWLPFSLDITLAIMPFLYFGYKIRLFNPEKRPLPKLLICFAIWVITIYLTFPDWQERTYFELAVRRYPIFPICFICAIAGTMFISELGIICCRIRKVFLPLIILGKNSLYFFCIHILDSIWMNLYYVEDHQFITAGRRLLSDLIIFAAFILLKYLFGKIKTAVHSR